MHRVCMMTFGLFVALSAAYADDVYLKSKEKKTVGTVKQETGLGVVITGVKDMLPADDIVDIEYEVEPVTLRTAVYRAAVLAEKDSLDPSKDAKRRENLKSALDKYEESLKKLGPGQEFARRNLLYKVSTLSLRQAQEDGTPPEPAITQLNEFRTKYPNSWQISRCLKLLAQLQLDAKKYKEAEAIYKELAAANVSADTKQEAQILSIQSVLASGNVQAADTAINAMIAKLPKDSKHAVRAQIAQAECMVASKKAAEATKSLRQIIRDTNDKSLKAMAYNTLGKSLYDADKLAEARWEFLWVDVVYNQDRSEHARALYYLWKIFDKLGEPDRAIECRETLLGDRQFTGSDWYRRAKVESAKSQ